MTNKDRLAQKINLYKVTRSNDAFKDLYKECRVLAHDYYARLKEVPGVEVLASIDDTILQSIATYDYNKGSFTTWLNLLLKQKVHGEWKNLYRKYNRAMLNYGDIASVRTRSGCNDVESEAIANDLLDKILKSANKRQKEVLLLKLAGHSSLDISKEIGTSHSYVRAVLVRLKKKIVKIIRC